MSQVWYLAMRAGPDGAQVVGRLFRVLWRVPAQHPRVEPRRRMAGYVRELLGELERKSGWSLARLPVTPAGMACYGC
jgi:hypothetical protein